ncbi:MAG: hypothetical protein H6980_02425 [Gammaproteobacteria bacterium]|nr:hypothetical protein [Gammaproteobacteria bacterium]
MADIDILDPLALTFLRRFPDDASVILAGQPVATLLAVLDQGLADDPPEKLAGVLNALQPGQAADVVAAWPMERIGRIHEALDDQSLGEIFGLLSAVTAKRLLEALPRRRAVAVRRFLGHPTGSVGRHMQGRALTLPDRMDVSEARAQLRLAGPAPGEVAFLLDAQRRVSGYVRLAELAGAEPETPLVALSRALPARLKTGQTLHAVRELPAWRELSQLPVLTPQGRFAGVLSQAALLGPLLADREGEAGMEAGARADTAGELLRGLLLIAETVWIPLARLFAAAAGDQRRADRPPRPE